MLWNRNKLFCDINPTCYKISLQKEIVKRHVQNMLSKEKFAGKIRETPKSCIRTSFASDKKRKRN